MILNLSCYRVAEVTITNNMEYYGYPPIIPKQDGWLKFIFEGLKEFNLDKIIIIIVIHSDGVSVMVFISSVYTDLVVPERLKAISEKRVSIKSASMIYYCLLLINSSGKVPDSSLLPENHLQA